MVDWITKYVRGEAIEFYKSTNLDAPGWFATIGNSTFRLHKIPGSGWWAFDHDNKPVLGSKTMTGATAKLMQKRDKGEI